ncbi:MAG: hypothetical protein JF586_07265 [Burkholderiales bacterium]|nr:hypothetical protein [Burkholderiales bacterium]
MFVTLPDYRFHIPAGLAQPGAQYWHTLGISCNAAWFLLTLHPGAEEGLQDTFLLTWDTDVADGIESMQREIASLLCIAPPASASRNYWSSFAITEVWRATDPEQEDIPCVLFVGEDGQEYSGLFGSRAQGLVRENLVARIKPWTGAANEGMCGRELRGVKAREGCQASQKYVVLPGCYLDAAWAA